MELCEVGEIGFFVEVRVERMHKPGRQLTGAVLVVGETPSSLT